MIEPRFKHLLLYSIICIAFFCQPLLAAITEEEPLNFGTFAIAGNDTVSTLTVRKNGGTPIYTNKIYPLAHGSPGQYRLTAFPAFTILVVNIPNFTLQRTAAPSLLVEDFTFDSIISDANGAALLNVGATLKTSGLGGSYGDGNYNGAMSISISW